jgi:hypothetical protein
MKISVLKKSDYKGIKRKKSLLKPAATLLIIILVVFAPEKISADELEESVIKAYQLRMDGKMDEAKNLLMEALSQDSVNAMANFEMARLIGNMDPRNIETILHHSHQAVISEPDNAMYRFYFAQRLLLKA